MVQPSFTEQAPSPVGMLAHRRECSWPGTGECDPRKDPVGRLLTCGTLQPLLQLSDDWRALSSKPTLTPEYHVQREFDQGKEGSTKTRVTPSISVRQTDTWRRLSVTVATTFHHGPRAVGGRGTCFIICLLVARALLTLLVGASPVAFSPHTSSPNQDRDLPSICCSAMLLER